MHGDIYSDEWTSQFGYYTYIYLMIKPDISTCIAMSQFIGRINESMNYDMAIHVEISGFIIKYMYV